MKKIILFLMPGLIFLTGTVSGTEMRSSASPPTGVWIKLNINLHRQKMNCERGFGLCFIFTWGFEDESASSEKNACPARGMLNERNQLVIELDEAALARYEGGASLPYFRGKSSVTIPETYDLPESTCSALGSKKPLTVKPGNYPVSCKGSTYTITFQF
jgi:hypothetical protein